MLNFAIGFIGSIGSGKSTISGALAEELNLPVISFGNYVRKVAKELGMDPESREVLQNVGSSLINKGWESFCTSVMEQVNWQPGMRCIIDGIRHKECIDTLRSIVKPSQLLLIFVDLDDFTQCERLRSRNNYDIDNLNKLEVHSTEREVKAGLRCECDLIIDGKLPIKEVIEHIVCWLHKKIENNPLDLI